MIRCCNGCTARRMRCHVWGECVQYMNEKARQDAENERKMLMHSADYDPCSAMKRNKEAYYQAKYRRR